MLNGLIELGLRFRLLRLLLDRLQIRKLANLWLRSFPRERRLPGSGVRFRMRSLDSLLVAREVFDTAEYARLKPLGEIRSFADIGCNCGFFTCFVMDAIGDRDTAGLLVDANPRMAEEAKWHISANGFTNVHAEWGLVGGKPDEPISTFYLHSDDAGSSQFPHSPESHVTRTKWQPIETPTLSLGAEWRKRFGKMPCDLLKIDVEGSEGALLHDEADFLDNVRRIVIEVHHWLVDVAALERLLREKGFELETKTPSGDADVRIYRNRNFAAAA